MNMQEEIQLLKRIFKKSLTLLKKTTRSVLMKDQYTIDDGESKQDKWNRGLDIFIESVHKPDTALRQCAHNQKCYHELMDVRKNVLDYLHSLRWHD
jgi:hypothetical protein